MVVKIIGSAGKVTQVFVTGYENNDSEDRDGFH